MAAQQTVQNGKNMANQAKSAFKDAKDTVKSKAQDVAQDLQSGDIGETVDSLTGTLKKSFGEVTSQFEDQITEARDMAQKYVGTLTDYYKEHPVRVLVSAVGIGIVLGRLLASPSKPAIAKK